MDKYLKGAAKKIVEKEEAESKGDERSRELNKTDEHEPTEEEELSQLDLENLYISFEDVGDGSFKVHGYRVENFKSMEASKYVPLKKFMKEKMVPTM